MSCNNRPSKKSHLVYVFLCSSGTMIRFSQTFGVLSRISPSGSQASSSKVVRFNRKLLWPQQRQELFHPSLLHHVSLIFPFPSVILVRRTGAVVFLLLWSTLVFDLQPLTYPSDKSKIAFIVNPLSRRAAQWATIENLVQSKETAFKFGVYISGGLFNPLPCSCS